MTEGEKLAYDFFYGELNSDRSAISLAKVIQKICERTLDAVVEEYFPAESDPGIDVLPKAVWWPKEAKE